MAPNLKLTYFNGKGRAETTRIAFNFGGIEFEDERITGEDVPKYKPIAPLGQFPILTVDQEVFGQSQAIFRYACKLAGLYPSDDHAKACAMDMILDTINELVEAAVVVKFMTPEEEKPAKIKAFYEEKVPKTFGNLSKLKKGTFFLGQDPTMPDVALFSFIVDFLAEIPGYDGSKYPELTSICEAFSKHPKISSYLAKRA